MQSQTSVSPAEYDRAMILAGKWCYNYGNAEAQGLYSQLYGIYLTNGGMATEQPPAERTQQRPAGSRTQTQAGAGTRPQRIRTAPGTPGPKDARVLARIVSNSGVTTEELRKHFARSMGPHILGTSLSRLQKGDYISGTPKTGPWTATATGIAANQRQPTSINTRRRSTAVKASPPPSEQAGQLQQAG